MVSDDARNARRDAERKLKEAQAREPEVQELVASLEQLALRNGFGAMIQAAMAKRGR